MLIGEVGEEARFDQHTGHGGFAKHHEGRFFHPPAAVVGHPVHAPLDEVSELETLRLVGVLVHAEHDVALGAFGIEAVTAAVIVFQLDHGVFALFHIEGGFVFADTEHVGFGPANMLGLLHGVAVQADEEVGLARVGNFGAALHRHETVALTGHDHIEGGIILLKILPQVLRDAERDVLLFAVGTGAARIIAAVAGVNHHPLDGVGRGGQIGNIRIGQRLANERTGDRQ